MIDRLDDATLLISTSCRDELIVTLSSLYHIPAYQRKIVGLIIPGHSPVSAITQQILDDVGAEELSGARVAAVNVFVRTRDGWNMVLHHGSPVSAGAPDASDV